jgi:hypothetical protein
VATEQEVSRNYEEEKEYDDDDDYYTPEEEEIIFDKRITFFSKEDHCLQKFLARHLTQTDSEFHIYPPWA